MTTINVTILSTGSFTGEKTTGTAKFTEEFLKVLHGRWGRGELPADVSEGIVLAAPVKLVTIDTYLKYVHSLSKEAPTQPPIGWEELILSHTLSDYEWMVEILEKIDRSTITVEIANRMGSALTRVVLNGYIHSLRAPEYDRCHVVRDFTSIVYQKPSLKARIRRYIAHPVFAEVMWITNCELVKQILATSSRRELFSDEVAEVSQRKLSRLKIYPATKAGYRALVKGASRPELKVPKELTDRRDAIKLRLKYVPKRDIIDEVRKFSGMKPVYGEGVNPEFAKLTNELMSLEKKIKSITDKARVQSKNP